MKVYQKFIDEYPDIRALNAASKGDIEKALKPLGFWRIRARDLKRMAAEIVRESGGKIPREPSELERLSGVGRYVTTAMLCFCYGEQQPIVDVNVRRIMQRIFFWNKDLPNDKELELTLQKLIPEGKAKQFNWALLDFSAKVCAKNPRCGSCFAKRSCKYYLDTNSQNA